MFLLALACSGPTKGPPPGLGDGSPDSLAQAVDQARLTADLTTLAVSRPPGSPGWQAAQDECFQVFTDLGLTTERHDYGTGINVIGRLAGTAPSDGAIVVSAHYDSVDACEGADDNASGVAGVLEAARVMSGFTFEEDVVFACWDEEESGLVGSQAWAGQNTGVSFAWSLEMIGFRTDIPNTQAFPFGFDVAFPAAANDVLGDMSRGNFIAFIADAEAEPMLDAMRPFMTDPRVVDILLTDNQLTNPLFADLARSDHASFWLNDVPAVMLTDTANFRNNAYHCAQGEDSIDRLDLDFATAVVRGVVGATATQARPSP